MKNFLIPTSMALLALALAGPVHSAQQSPATAPASQPAAREQIFSAVRRNAVSNRGDWVFVRFADGKIIQPPTDAKERTKVLDKEQPDGPIYGTEDEDGASYTVALTDAPGVVGKALDAGAWEEMTPGKLLELVEALATLPRAQRQLSVRASKSGAVVYAFRTKHGTIGLARLRALGTDGAPVTLQMESKVLVDREPATAASR